LTQTGRSPKAGKSCAEDDNARHTCFSALPTFGAKAPVGMQELSKPGRDVSKPDRGCPARPVWIARRRHRRKSDDEQRRLHEESAKALMAVQ